MIIISHPMLLRIYLRLKSFLHFFLFLIDRFQSQKITSSSLIRFVEKHNFSYKENLKKICFFAHFDPTNRIAPYVFYHLEALQKQGFEIVFCSANENLSLAERLPLKKMCSWVITRKNRSLDFGSWKVALETVSNWDKRDFLLFTNDSIFGPFFPLENVLKQMTQKPADLWGITDSFELGQYHLQSYFLFFQMNEKVRSFLKNFWNHFVFIQHKNNLVRQYEIGLSQQARAAGLILKAYCPIEESLKHSHTQTSHSHSLSLEQLNPLHHFWKTTLLFGRSPYLKKDFILSNPKSITNAGEWKQIVHQVAPHYPLEWIDQMRTSLKKTIF